MMTGTLVVAAAIWGLAVNPPAAGQKAPAAKEPEAVRQARVKLAARLKQLRADKGQVVWINEPELGRLFPHETFFAVRFPQFPVARPVPEHLKPSNVFAVSEDKVQRIRDLEDVGDFLMTKVEDPVSLDRAREVVLGWLALGQEFVQDGHYTFHIDRKNVSLARQRPSPREVDAALAMSHVKAGGSGRIMVTLFLTRGYPNYDFSPRFEFKVEVRPGPRPR